MKFSKFIILLFLIPFISEAQEKTMTYLFDEGQQPRERFAKFNHLEFEVSFEPENRLVKGKVIHYFEPIRPNLDSLFFDAPSIRVSSVKMNEELKYKSTKEGIWVYFKEPLKWEKEFQIEISYEANPKKGLYFIGWDDSSNRSRKQIWTQGQGIDNRYWLPCFDDMSEKVTTNARITMDERFEVLSNGLLKKKKPDGKGNLIWEYKMENPYAPYLIMLGIGEYKIDERKSANGTPIKLYYYPDQKDRVKYTYLHSEDMFSFMEQETGLSFPWETYAQIPVQDYMYGAMENTTATLFTDAYMVDERGFLDRNYVRTNAHELAHHWFGDYVTSRSSAHHWLHESFATYYHTLYTGKAFGNDHFLWKMREHQNTAINADDKNRKGVANSHAGFEKHYLKGAFVLKMLRYVVGDEIFKKSINFYLNSFPYGTVETDDFRFAFHESTGIDLTWFFNQWVKKGGYPEYKVDFYETVKNGKMISVFEVEQKQDVTELTSLFKMPIVFEVHYKNGKVDSKKEWIEKRYHKIEIPNEEGEIAFVLFDPNNEVLKKVDFNKSSEMLYDQALNAPSMIDRYDALIAYQGTSEMKTRMLSQVYDNEEYWALRAEVGKIITNGFNPNDIETLRKCLQDENTKVIREVINGMLYFPPQLKSNIKALLQSRSYDVIARALEILYFNFPENYSEYLEITKNVIGIQGKNVRMKWLEIAINEEPKGEYINELMDYLSNGFDFQTRSNAAEVSKRLNLLNEAGIQNMYSGMGHQNRKVKSMLGKTIQHFYRQIKYQRLMVDVFRKGSYSASQQVAITKWLN